MALGVGHLDSHESRKHQLPVPVAKETVKPLGDICAAAEPSADGAPTNKQPADVCLVSAMKLMSLEWKKTHFSESDLTSVVVSSHFVFVPIWGNDQLWLKLFRWMAQPPTSIEPNNIRIFIWKSCLYLWHFRNPGTRPKCNCSVANSADEMTGKKSGVSKMGVGRMLFFGRHVDDFCWGPSRSINRLPKRPIFSSDL